MQRDIENRLRLKPRISQTLESFSRQSERLFRDQEKEPTTMNMMPLYGPLGAYPCGADMRNPAKEEFR